MNPTATYPVADPVTDGAADGPPDGPADGDGGQVVEAGPVPRREPARRPNTNRIAVAALSDYCPGHPVGPLDGATPAELRELTRHARDRPVMDRHDDRERWVGDARRGVGHVLTWLETFVRVRALMSL